MLSLQSMPAPATTGGLAVAPPSKARHAASRPSQTDSRGARRISRAARPIKFQRKPQATGAFPLGETRCPTKDRIGNAIRRFRSAPAHSPATTGTRPTCFATTGQRPGLAALYVCAPPASSAMPLARASRSRRCRTRPRWCASSPEGRTSWLLQRGGGALRPRRAGRAGARAEVGGGAGRDRALGRAATGHHEPDQTLVIDLPTAPSGATRARLRVGGGLGDGGEHPLRPTHGARPLRPDHRTVDRRPPTPIPIPVGSTGGTSAADPPSTDANPGCVQLVGATPERRATLPPLPPRSPKRRTRSPERPAHGDPGWVGRAGTGLSSRPARRTGRPHWPKTCPTHR